MRGSAFEPRAVEPKWEPPTIVTAPGAFTMPIGPVFSDFAESAHFLLESVGEDVIRTIPRFFYKYRGVEKIAEGQPADRALLLAERFSGIAAFAHGLAFCQAVEAICGIEPPPRAQALRTVFAELERLRSHAAAITGICNSTALAVATSQAALIEEDLLRLSCEVTGHRYLFGSVVPGGVACDLFRGRLPAHGRRRCWSCREIARSFSDAALFIELPRPSRRGRDRGRGISPLLWSWSGRSRAPPAWLATSASCSLTLPTIRSISPFQLSRKATAMPACEFCSARRSNR